MAKIYQPQIVLLANNSKKMFWNKISKLLVLLLIQNSLMAQPVSFNGPSYFQDFQSLTPNAAAPATIAGTRMMQVSNQAGGGTVTGWYLYQAGGTPKWGRTDGSSSTGSFYAMYDGDPTPNRALGSEGSANLNNAFWGVILKNTSGVTITAVKLSYDPVMNRNPSNDVNPYPMSYRVSAANVITSSVSTGDGTFNDAAGTWIPGIGFSTPASGAGAPGAQNAITPIFSIGNASITQALTGLNWGNNQYLYIRWKETDDAGSDAIGGIDNFFISTCPAPTISAPAAINVYTNDGCAASGINLGTPVTAADCGVASLSNNAPLSFPLGTTTVIWTVTDFGGFTATASQSVTVTDTLKPAIYLQTTGLLNGITGPTSSQSPYLKSLKPGIQFTSLISVNDLAGGYRMAGVPDGMGAFDNGNGTFTLLVNHEILNTLGVTRAHGSKGSFVSKWIINKSNLSVLSGSDLMQNVNLWDTTTHTYTTYNSANPSTKAIFGRFCSADLPQVAAFYNSATGLGTTERIFLDGEETNDESRQMAHVVTGPNGGTSWELPALGKASWENSVANPASGNKTVIAEMNDGTDGQVYIYIGTKTNTGSEIEKAGLTNGKPYGVKVTGFPVERVNATTINPPPAPGTHFDLVDLGDVTNITGVNFNTISNTALVTKFSRPEDGAWDPSNPADLYFNTTDQLDLAQDALGTQTGRTKLWRLRFTDITHPELGGTVEAVLDGTEGINMLDNMAIDHRGHILLQEDVGNADHNGKIWQYNIATDSLFQVAKHDPARFGDVVSGVITPATAPFNKDEESSGIIDVSDILGQGTFITTVQAHYAPATNTEEVVEGGQLLVMYNPYSLNAGSAPDTVRVSVPYGSTSAVVNLGTPATADNCSVASVTNNAPNPFPIGNTNVTWSVIDGSGNTNTQVVIVTVNPNVPPTVSITSPVSPATFNAGSTIPVDVSANDVDGTITKVELFSNGVFYGIDSIAPYTFTGNNVEPGIYKVTAKATDNTGAFAVSDTTVITVIGCNGGGAISGEGFSNIPGSQVTDLTSNPAYPNNPSVTAVLNSFEYKTMGDNYGARVRGYICAPVTGLYRFKIAADDQAGLWLSTDENPDNKVLIAYAERTTGFRQWNTYPSQTSGYILLTKGARYYIETLHKQKTDGNYLSVGWTLPGGVFEAPIPEAGYLHWALLHQTSREGQTRLQQQCKAMKLSMV